MKFKIFKLFFKTPCRFGDRGVGIEKTSKILHSDTIFNALINALSCLFFKKELDEFLENELSSPSFIISSGFPFYKDKFYFPKISWPMPLSDKEREKHSKDIKSLEFVEKSFFEKWINGEPWNSLEPFQDELSFIKEYLIAKNSLSRLSEKSRELYYLGAIKFEKGVSGIWFAIKEIKDGIIDKYIKPAFEFLQDHGIGSKRNWGLGTFDLKEEEIELKIPANSSTFINLNLTFPSKEDIELLKQFDNLKWQLIIRGGYPVQSIYSSKPSLRKPFFHMIKEGSVLPEIKGSLIKIPDSESELKKIGFPHFVYHYGKSFLIPVNLKSI